jgi:hypothetical protein
LGWNNRAERDRQVAACVEKLKSMAGKFILLQKPADNDFLAWYPAIQEQYDLKPFVSIAQPDTYTMVNRYVCDDQSDLFFFTNSNLHHAHRTKISFPKEITAGKHAWVWDLDHGERYRIELDRQGGFDLYLGPADSRVIVFDRKEKGVKWNPLPVSGKDTRILESWDVEFRHSLENSVETDKMYVLEDLKNTKRVDFTGTAVYRKKFSAVQGERTILNLGKVYGISDVKVNGIDCGVTWYGHRLYDITDRLKTGENEIEVHVVTTMGNYLMKFVEENKVLQRWLARPGRAPQPIQSMGLAGPVTLYGYK